MRLAWREMARNDRFRIMDHIAQDNPAAAISLDEKFAEKARLAAQTPSKYKPGRYPGTREIIIHPNYVMVYRITREAVEIIRILHARQQWP
jgi:toxin ParE1/3/4